MSAKLCAGVVPKTFSRSSNINQKFPKHPPIISPLSGGPLSNRKITVNPSQPFQTPVRNYIPGLSESAGFAWQTAGTMTTIDGVVNSKPSAVALGLGGSIIGAILIEQGLTEKMDSKIQEHAKQSAQNCHHCEQPKSTTTTDQPSASPTSNPG